MAATARRVDVQLVFDSDEMAADIALESGELLADNGLQTALLLALFCDARATPEELERAGLDDPRGWWGDALGEVEGDEYGSKLWLLAREKETPETLQRAREFCELALAFLVADGIAQSVSVAASWKARGVLSLVVEIQRPNLPRERFAFVWELQ